MALKNSLNKTSKVGGVEEFINTSYDNVKKVADNLQALLALNTIFENSNGIYLGEFISHPLVRIDGSPLQFGDNYLNTNTNLLYIYTSTGWIFHAIFYTQSALNNAVSSGPFNIWVAYADDALGTGITTNPINKSYIGLANNQTTNIVNTSNPSVFNWSLMRGTPGLDGVVGSNGTNGIPGLNAYIHQAYADSANGATNFNFTTGKYIGILTNNTSTVSNLYSDYTWNILQGTGTQGLPGLVDIQLPTVPTNLQAFVNQNTVRLTWDTPPYSGHWYTKVYRVLWDGSNLVNFSETFLVAEAGADFIDVGLLSNQNYLYWARHVNLNSVASVLANSGAGLQVITLTSLIDTFNWVDTAHLKAAIRTRLDNIDTTLIDGKFGLLGAHVALKTSHDLLNISQNNLSNTVGDVNSGLIKAHNDLQIAHNLLSTIVGDNVGGLVQLSNSYGTRITTVETNSTTNITRLSLLEASTKPLIDSWAGPAVTLAQNENLTTATFNITLNATQDTQGLLLLQITNGNLGFHVAFNGVEITEITGFIGASATIAWYNFAVDVIYDEINSTGLNIIKVWSDDFDQPIINKIELRKGLGGAYSRIASLDNLTSTQAVKLSSLGVWGGTSYSTIDSLLSAKADHTTKLNSLGTFTGNSFSVIDNLNQTDINNASAITALTTTVNTANVNLMINFNFEGTNISHLVTGVIDTVIFESGLKSLKISTGNQFAEIWIQETIDGFSSFTAGQAYTIGFWGRNSDSNPRTFGYPDSGSGYGSITIPANSITWTWYTTTFIVPLGFTTKTDINGISYWPFELLSSTIAWVGQVNLDRVVLIRGNQTLNGSETFTTNEAAAASASAIDALNTKVNTVNGILTPLASHTASLGTWTGTGYALIETHSFSLGGLQAQKTIKIDVNGNIAGYGLATTTSDSGNITSAFTVLANQFSIANPTISNPLGFSTPFLVSGGVVTMDTAFIQNLTASKITGGTIGANDIFIGSNNLAIRGAKFGVGKGSIVANDGINDILTLGFIDSTNIGLLIKDNTGSTVFKSSVDTASVIRNTSQQWVDIGGIGKPIDNADVTANNTAANIAGQGALATQNNIALTTQVTGFLNSANADAGLINSNIFLLANGTLTGAGGGIINALNLLNGPAVPGADVSGTLSIVGSTGMTLVGNTVEKTGGVTAVWDEQVYSTNPFTGGAVVSFKAAQDNKGLMLALNTDPLFDASFTSLDYAFFLTTAAAVIIYENGSSVGNFGAYNTLTEFSIIYDGYNVKYYKDGIAVRTVTAGIGKIFYLDSSFSDIGAKVTHIQFLPYSPSDWNAFDSRPLELTDGRVAAGLSSLGFLDFSRTHINKSLANVDLAQNTKLTGIAPLATVGATVGTNILNADGTNLNQAALSAGSIYVFEREKTYSLSANDGQSITDTAATIGKALQIWSGWTANVTLSNSTLSNIDLSLVIGKKYRILIRARSVGSINLSNMTFGIYNATQLNFPISTNFVGKGLSVPYQVFDMGIFISDWLSTDMVITYFINNDLNVGHSAANSFVIDWIHFQEVDASVGATVGARQGTNLFKSDGTSAYTTGEIENSRIALDANGVPINTGITVPVENAHTTPADIGYTGALNANYITNSNQLIDGANWGGTATWATVINRPTNLAGLDSPASVKLGLIYTGVGAFSTLVGTMNATNISTYITGAAIGTALIKNAAITNALIADAAISNAKILDGTILSAKIGVAQILAANIGLLQVTNAHIANLTVDTLQIKDGAITTPTQVLTPSTQVTAKTGAIYPVWSVNSAYNTGAKVNYNNNAYIAQTFINSGGSDPAAGGAWSFLSTYPISDDPFQAMSPITSAFLANTASEIFVSIDSTANYKWDIIITDNSDVFIETLGSGLGSVGRLNLFFAKIYSLAITRKVKFRALSIFGEINAFLTTDIILLQWKK